MDKGQLRLDLQKSLREMSEEQRSEKSRRACQNLISTEQFQKASTIMIYLPLPTEVDCCDAILHAWQLGRSVAVPKISWQQRHMIPVEINSLETDVSIEVGGLKNPVTGVPVPLAEIDLVVTPALGFDKKGNRLGRGGSYYDRFFANEELKAAKCGLAFQEQVVDSLPTSEYDKAVDFLVTDEGVTYFNSD